MTGVFFVHRMGELNRYDGMDNNEEAYRRLEEFARSGQPPVTNEEQRLVILATDLIERLTARYKALTMNDTIWTPLHAVGDGIVASVPTATILYDGPTRGGYYWADIMLGDNHAVAIEWRPEQGYGVSVVSHVGYGTGHDFVFKLDEAAFAINKAIELLKTS